MDNSSSDDKDDTNLFAFTILKNIEYPLMVHSKDQEVLIDNDDDKERLLDTFNELLF